MITVSKVLSRKNGEAAMHCLILAATNVRPPDARAELFTHTFYP